MARAVYSQQFILYGPETGATAFDVPEGFTAVVRELSVYQEIGAYDVSFTINDSPEAPLTVVWSAHDVGVLTQQNIHGRWVVPETGSMEFFLSAYGDQVALYAGGYLLRND